MLPYLMDMEARFLLGFLAFAGLASAAFAQRPGIRYEETNRATFISPDSISRPYSFDASTVIRVTPVIVVAKRGAEKLRLMLHTDVAYLPIADQLFMKSIVMRVYCTPKLDVPSSASASLSPSPVPSMFATRCSVFGACEMTQTLDSHVQAISFSAN